MPSNWEGGGVQWRGTQFPQWRPRSPSTGAQRSLDSDATIGVEQPQEEAAHPEMWVALQVMPSHPCINPCLSAPLLVDMRRPPQPISVVTSR